MKLAGYMIRAPMSLEKMTYDAATGTVIYRSKMHLGLKRNFQVMPGAEWLELLRKHIPDRHEHLVRYLGWYSNRARGERAKALKAHQPAKTPPAAEAALSEFATRAKALGWGRGPTLPRGRGSSAKSTKPIRSSVPNAEVITADTCAYGFAQCRPHRRGYRPRTGAISSGCSARQR